jgi:hypothetical protein
MQVYPAVTSRARPTAAAHNSSGLHSQVLFPSFAQDLDQRALSNKHDDNNKHTMNSSEQESITLLSSPLHSFLFSILSLSFSLSLFLISVISLHSLLLAELRNANSTLIEYADGSKRWLTNNELHRYDGPAIENADGTKEWRVHGKRHRIDGPAVERANGKKEWWVHDQRHRVDGPAVLLPDGSPAWFIRGKLVDESHVTNIILLVQRAMRQFKRRIHTRRCARMNALKDAIGRDVASVVVQYLSFSNDCE